MAAARPRRRSRPCGGGPVRSSAPSRATLATIAEIGVEAPSAIVVGEVAALDFSWFEQRPLFGRRVVVTRAREQASELRVRLEDLGAEVLELPAIALDPIDFELPDLSRYAWVVFTSANGVDAFFDGGLAPAGLDARALGTARVAAIGPGTASALARRGIRADLVPERFVAESLLDAFPAPGTPDARVLLARAAVARDILPEGSGPGRLHRRRARGVPHCRGRPRPGSARARPRRRGRRDHVHVVVDRLELLRHRDASHIRSHSWCRSVR